MGVKAIVRGKLAGKEGGDKGASGTRGSVLICAYLDLIG